MDAGGKLEYLGKQVWTGNQRDIQRQDWESSPGSVFHSAVEVRTYRYASCVAVDNDIEFELSSIILSLQGSNIKRVPDLNENGLICLVTLFQNRTVLTTSDALLSW